MLSPGAISLSSPLILIFIGTKKTVSTATTRGWPGNTVSSLSHFDRSKSGLSLSRFPTPVRPGSGSKGYLRLVRLSVCVRQTPLALVAPLTKGCCQVKFRLTFRAIAAPGRWRRTSESRSDSKRLESSRRSNGASPSVNYGSSNGNSKFDRHTGVTDDITHRCYVPGMTMLQQTGAFRTESVGRIEHDRG